MLEERRLKESKRIAKEIKPSIEKFMDDYYEQMDKCSTIEKKKYNFELTVNFLISALYNIIPSRNCFTRDECISGVERFLNVVKSQKFEDGE